MLSQTLLLGLVFVVGTLGGSTSPPRDGGVGFAFSGAGGRLAQHMALMEALVKGLNPDGRKIRPQFISGASSGSISALALNAVLEYSKTQDKNLSYGFTWEDYKNMVFTLKTSDIYDDSALGIAKIFTHNIFYGYFLDNSPLRAYLAPLLKKMKYNTMKDIYLPTCITVVDQSTGQDIRIWSTDPQYADLDILDVIMASTALPMAFPPTKIPGMGDTIFIDGGTGIDTLPVIPLLKHEGVTEVYMIAYGSALTDGGSQLPPWLDGIELLANGMATINDMRVDLFQGAIESAAQSSVPAYTYIPKLNQSFSALDFDQEKLQYELAHEWAVQNNPTRVNGLSKDMILKLLS